MYFTPEVPFGHHGLLKIKPLRGLPSRALAFTLNYQIQASNMTPLSSRFLLLALLNRFNQFTAFEFES